MKITDWNNERNTINFEKILTKQKGQRKKLKVKPRQLAQNNVWA